MGGLKINNLNEFNEALKTIWIRRYQTGNVNWTNIMLILINILNTRTDEGLLP